MPPTPVQSAALATVAYEAGGGLLRLQFHDQTIYQFSGVPAAVHEALLRAPSKGDYFNRAIRGQFPYVLGPDSL